jgi:hypothetical protein
MSCGSEGVICDPRSVCNILVSSATCIPEKKNSCLLTVPQSLAESLVSIIDYQCRSLQVVTFCVMLCKLGVLLTESLPLLKRNRIYSYFDELLKANTSSCYSDVASFTSDISEALGDLSERRFF